jgi:hypothetical protein
MLEAGAKSCTEHPRKEGTMNQSGSKSKPEQKPTDDSEKHRLDEELEEGPEETFRPPTP